MSDLPNNLDDLLAVALSKEFENPLAFTLAVNLQAYRQMAEQLLELHNAASVNQVQKLREAGL